MRKYIIILCIVIALSVASFFLYKPLQEKTGINTTQRTSVALSGVFQSKEKVSMMEGIEETIPEQEKTTNIVEQQTNTIQFTQPAYSDEQLNLKITEENGAVIINTSVFNCIQKVPSIETKDILSVASKIDTKDYNVLITNNKYDFNFSKLVSKTADIKEITEEIVCDKEPVIKGCIADFGNVILNLCDVKLDVTLSKTYDKGVTTLSTKLTALNNEDFKLRDPAVTVLNISLGLPNQTTLINNRLYAGQYCYQESVNVSTACGGLNSGKYNFTSGWTNPHNVIDENWTSYGEITGIGIAYMYSNYTVPYGANYNSMLYVYTVNPINYTISDCIRNNNPVQIRLMSQDDGDFYYEGTACYNYTSSGWSILGNSSSTSATRKRIKEEAMWWFITSNGTYTSQVIAINTSLAPNRLNVSMNTYGISGDNVEGAVRTRFFNLSEGLMAFYDFDSATMPGIAQDISGNGKHCTFNSGTNHYLQTIANDNIIYSNNGVDDNAGGCERNDKYFNFTNSLTIFFRANISINALQSLITIGYVNNFVIKLQDNDEFQTIVTNESNSVFQTRNFVNPMKWGELIPFILWVNVSHVCLEINGSIGGALGCVAFKGSYVVPLGNQFCIGADCDGDRNYLNGSIDDVIIWNRSLSKTERDCLKDRSCLENWSIYSNYQSFSPPYDTKTFNISNTSSFVQLKTKMYSNGTEGTIIYSANMTFYTQGEEAGDSTPPSISIAPTNITTTNQSILWNVTFNEASNMSGTYGTCPTYSSSYFENSSRLTTLTYYNGTLTNSTTYCFNLTSFCDVSNNCNTTGYLFNFSTSTTFITTQCWTQVNKRITIPLGCQYITRGLDII